MSFAGLKSGAIGMSIVLLVLALTDVLFFQAGIDGIGFIKKVPGEVESVDTTTIERRVSKSGTNGALYEKVPAVRITFKYTVNNVSHLSTRYRLLNGGNIEVPVKAIPHWKDIRPGASIPVHYVSSTDTAFVEFGIPNAMIYWLKVYLLFSALFIAFLALFVLLNCFRGGRKA